MKKLLNDLTTQENIVNFCRVIAIFVVIACTAIVIKVISNPQPVSFGILG